MHKSSTPTSTAATHPESASRPARRRSALSASTPLRPSGEPRRVNCSLHMAWERVVCTCSGLHEGHVRCHKAHPDSASRPARRGSALSASTPLRPSGEPRRVNCSLQAATSAALQLKEGSKRQRSGAQGMLSCAAKRSLIGTWLALSRSTQHVEARRLCSRSCSGFMLAIRKCTSWQHYRAACL